MHGQAQTWRNFWTFFSRHLRPAKKDSIKRMQLASCQTLGAEWSTNYRRVGLPRAPPKTHCSSMDRDQNSNLCTTVPFHGAPWDRCDCDLTCWEVRVRTTPWLLLWSLVLVPNERGCISIPFQGHAPGNLHAFHRSPRRQGNQSDKRRGRDGRSLRTGIVFQQIDCGPSGGAS